MKKKLLCLLLCLPLATSVIACGDGTDKGGGTSGPITDVLFWGAHNTIAVMTDKEEVPENPMASDIVMQGVRGETESGQFIMTPKTGFAGNRSYTVTAAALNGPGGAEIGIENIEIFMQRYIKTKRKSFEDKPYRTANMWIGYYPDALIPFDRAVAKR
ncbi:MAG: hypothetical protein FWE62_05030, partial [Firmicutes bacterium]|nr:hypothetical protein [Bacillota bacterium]